MSEIKNLKPECIWRNFDALTQVPRPSGHREKVQKFLLDFAKNAGVEAFQDEAGNIVMRKPATPGMENRKTTILQAHMDMVPQKEKDSTHNFETDPIETYIDGDWVKAKGTTLGADDGLGVAAIMAVMEATDLKHGPIEALITADEETGMYGANDLPAAVRLTVKGLKGGHSGLEISAGRGNANKMLVRIVREAIADDEARLASWHGGNMRNAIPREAEAVLTLPKANKADLEELVNDYRETFNDEYKGIEGEIEVTLEDVELPANVVPQEIQDNLVDAIYAAHDGVWRYIPSIPDIVETSSNLAIVDIEGGKAAVKILARSSSETKKDELATSLESCFNMAGMKVELSGAYGGWDPNTDSELIKRMRKIYNDLFGNEPTVQVVHAGLECSIILSKYPDLDICSFGPTLKSPHTPNERAYWPSTTKFWDLLVKTLEEIPEK